VGSVIINADDSVTATITPPDDISDGPHTVDIIGENTSGEQVDVTETIEVGEPNGPCGSFPASGEDTDHDGMDDACDPLISTDNSPSEGDNIPSSVPSTTPNQGNGSLLTTTPTGNETTLQSIPASTVIQPAHPLAGYAPQTIHVTHSSPQLTSLLASNNKVAGQNLIPQVKGSQTTAEQTNSTGHSKYLAASVYRNPPKLDVLRTRNLFFVILIICLLVGVVRYKKRKEHQ
jgi:hypothetical protein